MFALGSLTRQQLALLAALLQPCASLRDLSISFAPEPSFLVQDLDPFGRFALIDLQDASWKGRAIFPGMVLARVEMCGNVC